MQDKNTQFEIDVLQRLTAIETILKQMDFKSVEDMAQKALSQSEKNAQDVRELQSYVKWFVMAVLGAFIAAVCALVFK